MKERYLIICKASINEGLGHFVRSMTLAEQLVKFSKVELTFYLISDLSLSKSLNTSGIKYICSDRFDIRFIEGSFNKIILDMLELNRQSINHIKRLGNQIISISPIFNHLQECDVLITRTKYSNLKEKSNIKVYSGMNYSIIRKDCLQIEREVFLKNLKKEKLNVAISMGGTDPENITLKVLSQLKNNTQPIVFWVLLGEGYEHQFELLVKEIMDDTNHEIILARTNKSMWHILSNCSLAILSGGLTSYEAAFAGLPAINILRDISKYFLLKELLEENLCLPICNSIEDTSTTLKNALDNKIMLSKINQNSLNRFRENPVKNVVRLLHRTY